MAPSIVLLPAMLARLATPVTGVPSSANDLVAGIVMPPESSSVAPLSTVTVLAVLELPSALESVS
jgi:hypothetical protein